MITVYGYGFEEPRPVEPPPTPWGTYAVLALAAWWAWGMWGKPTGQKNPRRRRLVRRTGAIIGRGNPRLQRPPAAPRRRRSRRTRR